VLSASTAGIELAVTHRLAPLLAHHCFQAELKTPEPWKAELRRSAATRTILEMALRDLAGVLDDLGVPWLPIKGMGPVRTLYPTPDCRPTSDLDILILKQHLTAAKARILDSGWLEYEEPDTSLLTSTYNWSARNHTGAFLELHHALWGFADPELSPQLVQRAPRDNGGGTSGRHSSPADCYLVAATHLWNNPPPRPLLDLVDLHLLALNNPTGLAEEVSRLACLHELQLPVFLAACAQHTLWNDSPAHDLSAALSLELKPPERWLVARNQHDLHCVPLAAIVLARLLSRRKSRTGWKAPIRLIARRVRDRRARAGRGGAP